jgi:hypothetical protein
VPTSARIEEIATEIANAFEYDKQLARVVATSNLVLVYNSAIEEAAAAAARAIGGPDRHLAIAVIRELRISD